MKNKEELFYKFKPNQTFPQYISIENEEAEQKFDTLFLSFGFYHLNGDLFQKIDVERAGHFLGEIDETNFSLSKHLHDAKLKAPEKVYIFYLNFNEVYEMKLKDLDDFFDDLYFPSANDMMVTDRNFTWLFYINDDCMLYKYSSSSA